MKLGSARAAGEDPQAGDLFLAFLAIALQGFGGVLPFARRTLVETRRWLSEEAFTETLALCQSLPGPNIVNLSVMVGSRFAGVRGALAALAGLIGAPLAIILAVGALYDRFGAIGALPGALIGLAAAAAGLVAATAARMAAPLLARRPVTSGTVMVLAFFAVAVMRWPLPWVMLVLAPVSMALAWKARP